MLTSVFIDRIVGHIRLGKLFLTVRAWQISFTPATNSSGLFAPYAGSTKAPATSARLRCLHDDAAFLVLSGANGED
jgi:hypothetical protein